MMIEAAIFDMDGLLIDSEPLWQKAETAIFSLVNIHLTPAHCRETTGIRIEEAVAYWYQRFPWDEDQYSQSEITRRIIERVIALIRESGHPLPGVRYILNFLKAKGLPISLASSSCMKIIEAVLEKLQLQNDFKSIHSAEFETNGKPHPAIFISTAAHLAVSPQHCLVFEDSINGLIAAKSARMQCVIIPEADLRSDKRLSLADMCLDSLEAFNENSWQQLNK